VVAISEIVKIPPIMAEPEYLGVNGVQLIQIKAEHKDPVMEPMLLGHQPVVHDGALVQTRSQRFAYAHNGSAVIARAQCKALVSPSSWKPYLNQAPQ
jgi:hypothetical protein